MKRERALTFVQKRIAEVRAGRLAPLERAAGHGRDHLQEGAVERRVVTEERPLLRGEVEPEVVVAEDGSVSLAPLEWSTEASDASEQ